MTEATRPVDDTVRRALVEVGTSAGDVRSVTRPLLDALQAMTELESTYLTSIHWDRQLQRIEVADNRGELRIDEGLEVPWEDTLCRRAMESHRYVTDDVAAKWPESQTAAELGIQTYVSVPVVLPDGEIYGTLCGASSRRVSVDDQTRAVLDVFARIVADTVARARQLEAASDRASESERLLRRRSEFVAAAQHRLKTPLTVIQGWVSLLLDPQSDMADDERRGALEAIARAAASATADVGSMLSESETEHLGRDLAIAAVDVAAVARRCCDDLSALSSRHQLSVELEHDAVPPAHTDPEALRIVLDHLIENAVKYSPGGGSVRVCVGLSDAGRVRISIRDEGIGLPTGVDIFAPFTRGQDRSIPGSGLGLHIVQSLVHALSGEVTARRNPDGPGSTMTVLLPPASGLRY